MRAGRFALKTLTRGTRGRILSTHRRAVNLLIDDHLCVTLLPTGAPLHPWAVILDGGLDGITSDCEVILADGSLTAGSGQVDARELTVVDLTIRARAENLGALPTLRAPLDADGPFEARISAGLAEFASSRQPEALAALLGAGEGLTPSGDDVIVGTLAAVDFAASASADAREIRGCLAASLPLDLREHTGRLSAQMLEAALAGEYPEPLVTLAEALASSQSHADAAVAALCAVGHRSGGDMLRGFRAALEVLR